VAEKTAALTVSNLEVVYHSVLLVLKGMSLEIPKGGIVALLGPNGAGKTTALRAITGMLGVHEGRVTKGHIELNGESLRGLAPEGIVRRGIAQVMEGRRVFAELTVEENLLAGAYTVRRSVMKEGLDRSYERFGVLRDRRRVRAGYLSGGEQQMLAIARALMSNPRVLLMDEPSLGLAPKIVAEVGRLIRTINEDGVSILLVEQNAALALALADHGYILENGRIVLDGAADQLREDEDIKEFYLGVGGDGERSYRNVKHYRRRKRWLA